MSKWDKYKVGSSKSPTNRWEKYKIKREPIQSNSEVTGKAFASGALSLADIPQNILALAESMSNARAKYDPDLAFLRGDEEPITSNVFSSSPNYISSALKKGIQNLAGVDIQPRPSNSRQKLLSHAGEFAGSMGPFGFIGKGAGLLNKFKNVGKLAGMGAATGVTSSVLQEGGVNPVVADLAASVAVPFAGATLPAARNLGEKGLLKLGGLTPKNFNLDAALAAKELGIDIPPAALTDSQWAALAHQGAKKLPVVGNVYKKSFNKTDEQVIKKLKDIYNKVGPEDTPEIRDLIEKRYAKVGELLPESANHFPKNTLTENEAVKELLRRSPVPSDAEKKVFNIVDTLDKNISLNSPSYGKVNIPYDVKGLVAGKRSLNNTINWDPEVTGVKNLLKRPRKGLERDIAEYGETNPEWYKSYKKADELFGKVEGRKNLEGQLGNVVNAYEELSYPALAKAINKPKQTKALKSIVKDEKTIKELNNIGKIANAMVLHNRNVPNPSGTAITAGIGGLLYKLATNPWSTISGTGGAALGGSILMSKLGTDKRFVDLAIKHIQNPNNLPATIALNERVKKITGYSAIALNKELNQQQEVDNGL